MEKDINEEDLDFNHNDKLKCSFLRGSFNVHFRESSFREFQSLFFWRHIWDLHA